VAYGVCEERDRLLSLYYETVEGHARLVSQIREVAGSRDHVLFEQLVKRSEEFRLDWGFRGKVNAIPGRCRTPIRDDSEQ
jgi:hypothetical protein